MPNLQDIKLVVAAEVDRALRNLDKIEKQVDDIGLKGRSSGRALGGLSQVFGGLVSVFAIKELAQASLQLGEIGAKAIDIEKAFNRVENSTRLLSNLRKAVRGTVPDIELMRSSLQGIDLGGTNEQLETFARFAEFEAARKGGNTLERFNEIISGVFRGSTELLDNFGFSLSAVNSEIANLAQAQGRTVGSLSAVERQGLLANAVLKLMKQRLEEAGETADSRAGDIQRNAAAWENLQVRIGKALLTIADFQPVFGSVISTIDKLLDRLGIGGAARIGELIDNFQELESQVTSQEREIRDLIGTYNNLSGRTGRSEDEQAELNRVIARLAELVPGAITAVNDYGQALDVNINVVKAFAKAQKELLKREQSGIFDSLTSELTGNLREIESLEKRLAFIQSDFDKIQKLKDEGQTTIRFEFAAGLDDVEIPIDDRLGKIAETLTLLQNRLVDPREEFVLLVKQLSRFSDLANTAPKKLADELGITAEQAKRVQSTFQAITKEVEAAAKSGSGGSSGKKTPQDQALQKQIQNLKQKIVLNKIELDDSLSTFDKMREAVRARYQDEIEAARSISSEKVRLLEEVRDSELAIINQQESEALDAQIKALQQKQALDQVELSGSLDKYDKMREAARIRYAEEIRIARETSDALAKLTEEELKRELKKIDLQELRDRQPEKVKVDFEANTDELLDEYDAAIERLTLFYQEQLDLAQGNAIEIERIEREKAEKLGELEDEVVDRIKDRILQQQTIFTTFLGTAEAAYSEFAALLLDTDKTGSEKRQAIWQTASETFVRLTSQMLLARVRANIQDFLSTRATEEAKTKVKEVASARQAALDAQEIATTTAKTTANTGEAASGFFKAHSGIPFIGFAIAAAFVAAMVASMASIKGRARGGIIRPEDLSDFFTPRGEDGIIGVQAGEFVVNRDATNRFRPQLEAINAGGLPPITAPPLPQSFGGFGGQNLIRQIERQIPIGGEVTLKTVAPDQAEILDYYIGLNRDVLIPDSEFVNLNRRTRSSEFDQ